jgi:repressor of nif and glnA expression
MFAEECYLHKFDKRVTGVFEIPVGLRILGPVVKAFAIMMAWINTNVIEIELRMTQRIVFFEPRSFD